MAKNIFLVTFVLIFIALYFLAVESLWNWLVPDIFKYREINYKEAAGITMLCHFLFTGGRK